MAYNAEHRKMARERREFMAVRSREAKAKQLHDRKSALREILDTEAEIPKTLKRDARELKDLLDYDDAETKELHTVMDDEYADAGHAEPVVLITTSHHPSQKLITFIKELRLVIPNAKRFNRGSLPNKDMIAMARQHKFTDLIVVNETRGEPDAMIVQHLPYGPTFYFTLFNVVMRHDMDNVGPMSEQYPHLIFENFTTKLGKRVSDGLKYLFPVIQKEQKEKRSTSRVLTFDNQNDFITFRHHVFKRPSQKQVELEEVGPRFDMRLFQIKQGTLDMPEAEVEWQLRPYQNTAKKRKVL